MKPETLKWVMSKINEVANDLREPQRGANLSHQADKLDKVLETLQRDATTEVHGGGTGED